MFHPINTPISPALAAPPKSDLLDDGGEGQVPPIDPSFVKKSAKVCCR